MVDAAEVGRFGTLRLMKSNEPNVPIASFPVDDETVTFGRDPNCSVRLYYAWVSSIHCNIIFEENKAFLQVLGTNGVVVDGCQVVPDKLTTKAPTTIPLLNGSTIEIYKKRFQFSYPPKDLRPMLLMTPHGKRHGNLRLSMIQSAHVFSPRPSPNPQENLRILQSPLKPFVKTGGPDDVVKLVDGNHPKVVEEDQDLVIMETVESHSSRHVNFGNVSPVPPQPPRTPRRRSAPSLHRAVLIRSAQRAAEILEAQQQSESDGDVEFEYERTGPNDVSDQELEEEEEVEEAVSAEMDDLDSDEQDEEMNPFFDEVVGREADSVQSNEGMEENDQEQDITEARFEHVGGLMESVIKDAPARSQVFSRPPPPSTPVSKLADPDRFKRFMTPQPRSILRNGVISQGPQRPPPGGRYSLGGPQRVKINEPWKVSDIVIEDSHANLAVMDIKVKNADTETQVNAVQPNANAQATNLTAPDVKTEHSEDIRSMLAKMKDTVASMRRKSLASRQSLAGIGRGTPLTPSTKRQNEFSLLAPSPFVSRLPGLGRGMGYVSHEDVVMEESGSQLALAAKEDYIYRNVEKTAMMMQESNEEEQSLEDKIDNLVPDDRTETSSKGAETIDVMFPKTPRMDGLKEMFRAPRAPPATPLFRGMREMFRTQKEVHTPRYDGLRDMLASPEAPEQEEDIVDAGIDDDSLAIEPIPRPRRGRSKQETPNASTMADDEATPADFGSTAVKNSMSNIDGNVPKGAVVRKSRSRRDASSERESTTESENPGPIKAPGRSTKARGAKQINTQDEIEVSEESSNSESAKTVRPSTRRGKLMKSSLPQIQESEDVVVDDTVEKDDQMQHSPTRQVKRRGVTKVKEETTETEAESVEAIQPAKRGRAKKTVALGSKAKTSLTLRGRSTDVDIEMDADPLDSIERPSSPEVQVAPISKPRRGRPKAAVMTFISEEEQPRRKATRARAIKSEPEDLEAEALSEQSTTAKSSTRKGATKQSIIKNAISDHQNDGKENAPDCTSGTEESADASKLVKTKAASVRSRTASKASKTTEDAAPAQRQTRSRRVK